MILVRQIDPFENICKITILVIVLNLSLKLMFILLEFLIRYLWFTWFYYLVKSNMNPMLHNILLMWSMTHWYGITILEEYLQDV